MIRRIIPARLKPWLRTLRQKVRHRWIITFFAFGPEELKALLHRLGVAPGDVVMVHSSFDRFEGFQGSLRDAMQVLQDAVGSEGGLLMPTLPFSGNAVEYVKTNAILDVKRTPSRMGFMTEIFRRLPGVSRSLHPTHPVAGWGAKAARLLESHRSARTPCGAGSPFEKLVEADGKLVLLGVSIRTMTFYHYLEEDLEARMPFSPFTTETFTLSVRDERGQTWPVVTRLYDPVVSGERDPELMVPHLKARGFWREQKVGGLNVIVLRCREVRQVVSEMASEGLFCYHDVPRLTDRRASAPRLTQT
jgi:aminoglycoside 3-N-acetyltransferase